MTIINTLEEAKKFFDSTITEEVVSADAIKVKKASIEAEVEKASPEDIEAIEGVVSSLPKIILRGAYWKRLLGVEPRDQVRGFDSVATLKVAGTTTIYGPFPARWLENLADDELYELKWYVECHNFGFMNYELEFVGFMLYHVGGARCREDTTKKKRRERKERVRAPKRAR